MLKFVNRHSSFVIRNSSFVILLLLLSWGCQKKPSVEIPVPEETVSPDPAPPAITPEVPDSSKATLPDPVSPENTALLLNSFDLGEADFYAGKYLQAALSFESYLSSNPKSEKNDQVLFLIGLSRAQADNSSRNQRLSEDALKQLISEFPDSPYRTPAEYILSLKSRIEKLRTDVGERNEIIKELSEELKKLKQIDMQRRPSRPE